MKRRRGDARLYQPLPIYGDALPRGGTAGANMKGTDTQARPQSRFTARCHVQQQQASALGATNSATLAVAWVERPEDMRALWYGGCFGKGSWNRSQPGLEVEVRALRQSSLNVE